MAQKVAIIIGAGPAGLTAAYELLTRSDIRPIILEACDYIGGISRTHCHNGNRIDVGGHRFFSKSSWVMQWWTNILPPQAGLEEGQYRQFGLRPPPMTPDHDPERTNRLFLIRQRISRILYLRKFFDYPISLSKKTLDNLGFMRVIKIGASYMKSLLFKRSERSLEDFFINRFGGELYRTFFRDYTQKVWGRPCTQIKPEWGAQRIKGLSVGKAIKHALMTATGGRKSQDSVETSLINQFLYPKLGPGQLWEEVARQIVERGGEIHMNCTVQTVTMSEGRVESVACMDSKSGETKTFAGDCYISSMPIKDLFECIGQQAPESVLQIASSLDYRDFITVGMLLDRMRISNQPQNEALPDSWIYVQEADVRLGRIQIFNNWSPYMLADPGKVWLGLEYFTDEGDDLWSMADSAIVDQAIGELEKLGLAAREDMRDAVVLRMKKAYPAYWGSYEQFDVVRSYVDAIPNLYLIGRNGTHRYNNQDHSMLSSKAAVDAILSGTASKDGIWSVNAESSYHEEKRRED